MSGTGEKYILQRLRQTEMLFAQKLRLTALMLPQVHPAMGVMMIKTLLDSALEDKPTLKDLYDLCEVSRNEELVHEYLRGFFLGGGSDPRKVAIAERLDEVITYRMSHNKMPRSDLRLKQTIAEYLLRAKD